MAIQTFITAVVHSKTAFYQKVFDRGQSFPVENIAVSSVC